MRPLITAALALALATPVSAQDLDLSRSNLPRSAIRHIETLLASSSTQVYRGDATIAAGETITVPVVMREGVLRVAGTVRNELVVLRGDVVFEPGAVVEGGVMVVSGQVHGEDNARITGGVTIYGEGFDLEGRSERREWRDRRDPDDPEWRWRGRGNADFSVHVAHNYNRVEGLPIRFGPDISTGGAYSTRLQALAIWRTDLGPVTRSRQMGYVARVEQFLGGETFRVGAGLHSVIQPIESWSLTDLEATIAAALFHDDQRDYFEREGWSVYARLTPPRLPLDLRVEYRDERHVSVPVADPWTLFNEDRVWRAQPRIGAGSIDLLRGSAEWDARRGDSFETRGWLARGELTRALSGTLSVARAAGGVDDVVADFTTGLIDLRRYERAGPGGILGMRVVAGGALNERALPPQYQHALGGPGTLPGVALFSADCGARSSITMDENGDVFFPAYGCDRFALAQVEYRGGFDLRFGGDHDDDDDYDRHDDERGWRRWQFRSDVDWTLFFDMGHGWALQQDRFAGRADTRTLYDVGADIIIGDVGIYGAVPLDDSARGLRLFARLGPRF
ncbi:MAG TPA: polymer-forming cytoskeletal protein [Longimicrobiales bacterium]|nr:polymer-forming cytoskeletal protein [Longimicrobiales bacterium]